MSRHGGMDRLKPFIHIKYHGVGRLKSSTFDCYPDSYCVSQCLSVTMRFCCTLRPAASYDDSEVVTTSPLQVNGAYSLNGEAFSLHDTGADASLGKKHN